MVLGKALDRMPEESEMFNAALLEVEAARKAAFVPRIAPGERSVGWVCYSHPSAEDDRSRIGTFLTWM